MNGFFDTSVILASLNPDEAHHVACDRLVAAGSHKIHGHALARTFSVLTSGRQGRRLSASAAARLIEQSVLPYVQMQMLAGKGLMACLGECELRGVRGGAVYDWLHLTAARRAGAEAFFTQDLCDFQALARPGDPRIEPP